MAGNDQFAIPETVRELAERNVEQARGAYAQMMDVARKAQEMMAQSQESATSGALDVHQKAISYAEQNMNDNFDHAMKLATAGDLQSALQMQQAYAQAQIAKCAEQTKDLSDMLMGVTNKAKKTKSK